MVRAKVLSTVFRLWTPGAAALPESYADKIGGFCTLSTALGEPETLYMKDSHS